VEINGVAQTTTGAVPADRRIGMHVVCMQCNHVIFPMMRNHNSTIGSVGRILVFKSMWFLSWDFIEYVQAANT
jgi:hypothetical protein